MKSTFRHFYPLTNQEIDALWKQGILAIDASALLNLYRLSESTTQEIFGAFEIFEGRLWLPYQAASEYQAGRIRVVRKQIQDIDKTLKSLRVLLDQFKSHKQQPFLEKDLEQAFVQAVESVCDALTQRKSDMEAMMLDDPIRARLDELFDSAVGHPLDVDTLEDLYKEGEKRYERKIPPGFADAKEKPAPSKYGDFLVWHEILKKCRENKQGLILVTDDVKEDWWQKDNTKNLGLLPALRKEFRSETGCDVLGYELGYFLYAAGERGGEVSSDSVEEISEIKRQMEWQDSSERKPLGSLETALLKEFYSDPEFREKFILSERILDDVLKDNEIFFSLKKGLIKDIELNFPKEKLYSIYQYIDREAEDSEGSDFGESSGDHGESD